jgi:diguanylate cyclase (GGDEF)-like protein
VLFLDLDDFKAVNDRYGHAAGDRLLRAAGQRLAVGVRAGDTVARLGGDEFAVLLEGAADPERVAQRLLDALREPYDLDGRTAFVGASVGLVDAADQGEDTTAEWLVRRADAAMYAGKRSGKNVLVRYHLDLPDENGASDLSQLLAAALTTERGLDVHYQPIVRLADGTVIAVEALARWTDPVVGPVPADLFISVAERAGLVGMVDDFVLDRACQDAASFDGPWAGVVVHVNVSAARFGETEQEAAVLRALHRHGLPPVVAATGRSAALCRSIVAICTEMGVRVIAEGIESDVQVAAMAALGCGYGQGHRYGRPGPVEPITRVALPRSPSGSMERTG